MCGKKSGRDDAYAGRSDSGPTPGGPWPPLAVVGCREVRMRVLCSDSTSALRYRRGMDWTDLLPAAIAAASGIGGVLLGANLLGKRQRTESLRARLLDLAGAFLSAVRELFETSETLRCVIWETVVDRSDPTPGALVRRTDLETQRTDLLRQRSELTQRCHDTLGEMAIISFGCSIAAQTVLAATELSGVTKDGDPTVSAAERGRYLEARKSFISRVRSDTKSLEKEPKDGGWRG